MKQHLSRSEIMVVLKLKYGMGQRLHGPILNFSILLMMQTEIEMHNLSIVDLILSMRIALVILLLLLVMALLTLIIMSGMVRAGLVL
mgnify:CR=1 FL=1